MQHFLVTHSLGGGLEVTGAATEADLLEAARERYSFLPDAPDYPAFCEVLGRHGAEHGWTVAATTREDVQRNLCDISEIGLDVHVSDEGPGV